MVTISMRMGRPRVRGGVGGLFAWRWLTTALVFGGVLLVARRLGARGSLPLLAIVVCGLICRFRSQLRPESLASIFLIAELLILETRRSGGRDRAWWIVPIACLW